jgi:HEPN domain-containing protein
MVDKAEQDELVLLKLLDDADIHDGTLGFHAQQAVEKRLKAVLSLREVEYRWTHSLAYLTTLLDSNGIMPPACRDEIEDLTPWASRARYEDTSEGALDRDTLLGLIRAVRQWSEELIGPTDWLSATAAILRYFAVHGGLEHLALLAEREHEAGVIHITLDKSAWTGSAKPLMMAFLVADFAADDRPSIDTSQLKDLREMAVGEAVDLHMGLVSIAVDTRVTLNAKQVLLFGRFEDDHSL